MTDDLNIKGLPIEGWKELKQRAEPASAGDAKYWLCEYERFLEEWRLIPLSEENRASLWAFLTFQVNRNSALAQTPTATDGMQKYVDDMRSETAAKMNDRLQESEAQKALDELKRIFYYDAPFWVSAIKEPRLSDRSMHTIRAALSRMAPVPDGGNE